MTPFAPFAFFALFALVSACGAKVAVDGEGAGGAAGAGAAGSGAGVGFPPLACGEEPQEGKTVIICVSIMNGDNCPPAATSPGLLATLAQVFGVCAETSPTACCDKPALRQVVCDLPPSGNECCYTAHYLEKVSCP